MTYSLHVYSPHAYVHNRIFSPTLLLGALQYMCYYVFFLFFIFLRVAEQMVQHYVNLVQFGFVMSVCVICLDPVSTLC